MPAGAPINIMSATLQPVGRIHRHRRWLHHAGARHRTDCAGVADMGADRRLDRASAETRRTRPAAGAISRRLSGQPRLSGLRRDHRALRPQRQYLAQPADDPGYPVVHPVQRHRRRQRLPDRSARSRRQLPSAGMAVVDQGDPARNLPLLHHRRHHRLGRIVECIHRRGSRKLGRHPSDGQGAGFLYSAGDRSRRFPARRARHRRDVCSGHLFNRLLWRPLYAFGERRLRLG